MPVNYLHGIPCFYEGADRAEILWEDAEVDRFCRLVPELHADAVRLARETGLRIGDLVELERSEIKQAPDGSRAIILRPNRRRRRIVNMLLTAAAEAIIDKAPISPRLILKPMRADTWDPARLSREVREYATELDIRQEFRFNDLRGTKVTEMVWAGISVPDLAIRIGWKIETAAKMLGVYAALNPGRATVAVLPTLRGATMLTAEDGAGKSGNERRALRSRARPKGGDPPFAAQGPNGRKAQKVPFANPGLPHPIEGQVGCSSRAACRQATAPDRPLQSVADFPAGLRKIKAIEKHWSGRSLS